MGIQDPHWAVWGCMRKPLYRCTLELADPAFNQTGQCVIISKPAESNLGTTFCGKHAPVVSGLRYHTLQEITSKISLQPNDRARLRVHSEVHGVLVLGVS